MSCGARGRARSTVAYLYLIWALPLSLISSIRHVVVEKIRALENGAVRRRLLGRHCPQSGL